MTSDQPLLPPARESPDDQTATLKFAAADSGDSTVKSLLYFSQPLNKIPLKVMFCTLVGIIREAVLIAFSTLGSQVLASSGFILLNYTDDSASQSYLGIAFSYNLVFFYGFFLALVDKLGIELSVSFGSKQYHLTKKAFNQGIYSAIIVFCGFTVPTFVFAKHFLMFVGVDESEADGCQRILYWLLIPDAIECAGDFLRTFCMAQGHEALFGPTSIVSMVVAVGTGYLLVVQYKLGVFGWLISRTVYELLCLLVAIWAMVRLTHRSTWGLLPWSVVRQGFLGFFWESIKFAVGSYAEFIGYEITSLFVYRSNNPVQIAGYSEAVNISSLVYSAGESFAVICRTRMNLLIGKGLKQTSKNFYIFFMVGTFLFGSLLGVGCYFCRGFIADLFGSSNPELSQLLDKLLVVYSVNFGFELTVTTTFMGVKTIGSINFLLALNLLVLLMGNSIGCYLLSKSYPENCVPLFICLLASFDLINICSNLKVMLTDWTKRELDYEPIDGAVADFSEEDNQLASTLVDQNQLLAKKSLGDPLNSSELGGDESKVLPKHQPSTEDNTDK